MRYRLLGRTGLEVSSLCFGAGMFGINEDVAECLAMFDAAFDAGVNFIDTADSYGAGESERIVGKVLKGRREKVVLATKAYEPVDGERLTGGTSRRWLIQECENSLRRLDTDYIDLYQMHRPDLTCDLDETLGALSDLVHAGKIRYAGCSTFPASRIVESQWVSERRNLSRFVCESPPYSILARGIEAEVLPTCQRYGMGAITWSPLAQGWLTGNYRKDKDITPSFRAQRATGRLDLHNRWDLSLSANQVKLEATEALVVLAEEIGIPIVHLALAFVTSHPAVTSAIIGPRTLEQVNGQLGAGDVVLDDDVLDRIDEIVPPGVTINSHDRGWTPPSIRLAAERRRTTGRLGLDAPWTWGK